MARRAWNTRTPTRDGAEGAGTIAPEDDGGGNESYLLRAPPKPAPDAMRISDAQLSEGIKWIDWNDALNIHDEMKQLRKAVERMFCLPLPTDCAPNLTEEICTIVDQCRNGHVIGAECAKAIYSAVAKHAALSAPVPPADGAPVNRVRIWDEERGAYFLQDSPSSAVLTEPEPNWDKIAEEYMPSTATPPVRGDREEIRLLIVEACDLLAERKHGNPARSAGHNARLALESALRLIPVQPGAGEREAARILRSWAKAYRDSPEHRFPSDQNAEFFPFDLEHAADLLAAVRSGAGERKSLSEYTNAEISNEQHRLAQAFLGDPHVGVTVPTRQAPHSSSEGGR